MILGFIDHGVVLLPNETHEVREYKIADNDSFRKLENDGKLQILSYDPDFTRTTIRDEVTGVGGGTSEETRTSGIDFAAEAVAKGNSFVYVLNPLPDDPDEVLMFVGPVKMTYGTDYTITPGGTINWLGSASFDISISDVVTFRYTVA